MLSQEFALAAPVTKKSAAIAELIYRAIAEGVYKPGEKLPPERTIAQQNGVSRSVVREALSALQIAGIVEIRLSMGTYVRIGAQQVNREKISQLLAELEGGESPLEWWEARKVVEAAAVAFAATKATATDLANAEALLKDMGRAVVAADFDGYMVANNRFHEALVASSGNAVLLGLMRELLAKTNRLLIQDPTKRYVLSSFADSFEKHRDIFDAFRARDIKALAGAIERHFLELESYYLSD